MQNEECRKEEGRGRGRERMRKGRSEGENEALIDGKMDRVELQRTSEPRPDSNGTKIRQPALHWAPLDQKSHLLSKESSLLSSLSPQSSTRKENFGMK